LLAVGFIGDRERVLPSGHQESSMPRTRSKQPKLPFKNRLASEALRLKEQAKTIPHGPLAGSLLRKARQIETASHIDAWLSSSSLQALR
jgi:hypothetical protein